MRVSNINSTNTIDKLTQMRNEINLSVLMGDYKNYKRAIKDYATFAVENKELLPYVQGQHISVSLFSKVGRSMLKIWFLNLFRRKSAAEKELKKYAKEIKLKNKYLSA